MSVSPKNSELHPVPQPPLNLDVSMPELTRALLDYESVSGNERTIADAVHTALSFCPHLQLTRDGDAIIARTEFPPLPGAEGERTRIILAGHRTLCPCPPLRVRWVPCRPRYVKKRRGTCSTAAAPPT